MPVANDRELITALEARVQRQLSELEERIKHLENRNIAEAQDAFRKGSGRYL